ncbi:MAG: 1-(5-phosphoribosyl)-5-[(5-phosphoribosylamino) methylideneamino] imidazole-4-carboxamide isomerase [bacterium]|nr:MAG: 1-(5-phosphoribosyl)-5-[(5-phosphoribosylamino) methylideneamino] imidazole-4-carboxamide isomerase [bacterium]
MLIIPAIDIKDGRCVRLVQGDYGRETVYADNPVDQARKWEDAGARMIHIVDLDGAKEGKPKNEKPIESICKSIKCPVQLGGGIRNLEIAQKYFDLGLSRIVLGTLLIKNRREARRIADSFKQKVLAGIDVKDNKAAGEGWTTSSDISPKEIFDTIADWPLCGIVYTDISRDGMMQGANVDSIREMAAITKFPLIASGGVSSRDDLLKLSEVPGVDAAIIGKALYTGAIDLEDVIKEFQDADQAHNPVP